MLEKLEAIEKRYQELEHNLADMTLIQDKPRYQKLAKEFSGLEEAVKKYRQLKSLSAQLKELEGLSGGKSQDADLLAMAKEEIPSLRERITSLKNEIELSLRSEDKEADLDVIVEIRAGTGGDEAGMFAADLFRLYNKYALGRGWEVELLSSHGTELGGLKEAIFSVKGKGAYKRFKYESGVHRVQRVPVTEASGRIHTSTATVAVMKEAQEVDLVIDPKDLKIDVFRSSGPGGAVGEHH